MAAEDGTDAPQELRVIHVSTVCAIGEINRCIATVWAGQPTDQQYLIRNNALVELTKRHPGHSALVEIVEVTSKPPSDASRKVAMEVFRKLGTDLCAIAFLMEGNSWRISIARAVIQSMAFIVPKLQPTKVFKQPAAMLAWVAEQQQNKAAEEFALTTNRALEHLRKLLHAERARITH